MSPLVYHHIPMHRLLRTSIIPLSLVAILSTIWLSRTRGVFRLDSWSESVIWTLKAWCRFKRVLPPMDEWRVSGYDDPHSRERFLATQESWKFLQPFFVSRGYYLYHFTEMVGMLMPHPSGPNAHPSPSYPYARRGYDKDLEENIYFVYDVTSFLMSSTSTLTPHLCLATPHNASKG